MRAVVSGNGKHDEQYHAAGYCIGGDCIVISLKFWKGAGGVWVHECD